MTNLFHLKIKIIHFLCKWKQIIINYLTKLKIFEFKMNIQLSYEENKIDKILKRFRSYF
jgi:hypothetical protein